MKEYGYIAQSAVASFLNKLVSGGQALHYFVITDDNHIEQHTNGKLDFKVNIGDYFVRERSLTYYKNQKFIELYNSTGGFLLRTAFLEKHEYYDMYEELRMRSLNKSVHVKYSKHKSKSNSSLNLVPLITKIKNIQTDENVSFNIKTVNGEYFGQKLRVDSLSGSAINYEARYVDASAQMYIVNVEEKLILNSQFVELKYGPMLVPLDLEIGSNYAIQFNPLNQEFNLKIID